MPHKMLVQDCFPNQLPPAPQVWDLEQHMVSGHQWDTGSATQPAWGAVCILAQASQAGSVATDDSISPWWRCHQVPRPHWQVCSNL